MLQFPDPLNARGTYDHRFSPPDKPVSKVLLFPQFADKEKTIQSATMIYGTKAQAFLVYQAASCYINNIFPIKTLMMPTWNGRNLSHQSFSS